MTFEFGYCMEHLGSVLDVVSWFDVKRSMASSSRGVVAGAF
jgi:hypothetical protein